MRPLRRVMSASCRCVVFVFFFLGPWQGLDLLAPLARQSHIVMSRSCSTALRMRWWLKKRKRNLLMCESKARSRGANGVAHRGATKHAALLETPKTSTTCFNPLSCHGRCRRRCHCSTVLSGEGISQGGLLDRAPRQSSGSGDDVHACAVRGGGNWPGRRRQVCVEHFPLVAWSPTPRLVSGADDVYAFAGWAALKSPTGMPLGRAARKAASSRGEHLNPFNSCRSWHKRQSVRGR